MYLYTNSLIVSEPLLFVNEIFKTYVGADDKRYLNPRTKFSLSFHLGEVQGYALDHASIFRAITEITSDTPTFWVELKRVEVIEDLVAGVYIGLIPESGAKELWSLFERLFMRKIIEQIEDDRIFQPYVSLGWIRSSISAEKVASEINKQQFAITWQIQEIRLSENIFPLKTS